MDPCPPNLWLKLSEDCWGLIMPFLPDADNTNLAEVFPKVADHLKTFVLELISIRPMSEQLELFRRCPKVNKLIVNGYPDKELMIAVATINQKIESIHGPCFESRDDGPRLGYVKKLWQMNCSLDHFTGTIPFHRDLPLEYRSLRLRIHYDDSIQYNEREPDYDKMSDDVFENVTEIHSEEPSVGLNRLIPRCPKLQTIFLDYHWVKHHYGSIDWSQPMPQMSSLISVVGSSNGTIRLVPQEMEVFLKAISDNTKNLEKIRFYGAVTKSDIFYIKNNLLKVSTWVELPLEKMFEMFPRIRTIQVEAGWLPRGAVTRILNQVDAINSGLEEPFTVVTDKPKFLKLVRRRV